MDYGNRILFIRIFYIQQLAARYNIMYNTCSSQNTQIILLYFHGVFLLTKMKVLSTGNIRNIIYINIIL